MNNWVKNTLLAGVLGGIAVSQVGCILMAAAAATGGTVAYVKGDTESSIDATPDKITAASKLALEEMNLRVISANGSALDGDVVARTAADDKVHIVIKAQGEKTSSISIRIGYFGDQAMSTRILGKINDKLKETGAVAAAKPATQPVTPAVAPASASVKE